MLQLPVHSPRPTPTLVYETAGRFFVRHSVFLHFISQKARVSQTKLLNIKYVFIFSTALFEKNFSF